VADINKTVAIIFQGQDQTEGALASVEKNLAGIGGEAKAAEGNLQKIGDEVEDLGKKGGGLEALVTGLKALGAGLVINAFIDANVAAEKFERSMTAVAGSTAGAAREFDYIRGVSNRMGLEVFGAADAYSNLSAATKGTAFEGAQTRTLFEAFSGTMATLGKSSADVSGALVQVAQGLSKGKFELEDLKTIAERVPGFFSQFADALGITSGELFKMVSAGQITGKEMVIFAEKLQANLGSASFDGYEQNLSRLKNSISNLFITVGESGVFDVLKGAIDLASRGVAGFGGSLEYVGGVFGAVTKLFQTRDLETFNQDLRKIETQFNLTADAISGTVNQSTAETARLSRQAAEVAEGLGAEFKKGADISVEAWEKASKDIDKSLKALGIDPKIFQDPLKEVEKAFTDLANNPALNGDKFLAGLVGALRALPADASLETFRQQVAYAFRDGRISADELSQALALLDVKQKGLAPSFSPATDAVNTQTEALKKQADATKKSEEAAAKMALELEKLASNERIKSIEARIKLNVAEVEADTKRIEAAFDSINTGITSTGDVIGKLFALFGNEENLSLRALSDMREQIDIENRFRQQAFDLQKKLTEAQIEQIRARTQAMQRGDAMIKIEGDGLEPELEAFMWKILRKVQTRVNEQGLEMLLGT
jgi:tape measure domain-containing protein